MKNYIRIIRKNVFSFLLPIFFLSISYPFQDSLKSQIPSISSISNEVVASVGPINITAEEFFYSYEFGPAFVKRRSDSKSRYLKYMVNEKLLALDGYERKFDEREDVASVIKDFENDIATEEMFKKDILSEVKISEEEVDTLMIQKQLELDLSWLYAGTEDKLNELRAALDRGIPFDSLYNLQFNDSIYVNDRSMKINRYQFDKKNPELAKIIDTLQIGKPSEPIKVSDGWYIVRLNNVRRNILINETELMKLRAESISALKKRKMDKLSDEYVSHLLLEQSPVIKRESFNILRSYLGIYLLSEEKYDRWNLSGTLKHALDSLKVTKENIGKTILIVMNDGSVKLEEFLNWYKNRSQYIKFNKKDLRSFSISLENLIWRMLRDKLLTEEAFKKNFNKTESFRKQARWWKDKIVYSAVRQEIVESVLMVEDEVTIDNKDSVNVKLNNDELNTEINRKLFHKLNTLKKKYGVRINEDVLEEIPVSDENNPKAIDFYTVKKGGLIPRSAYPTIDFEWKSWE